jgi:hypothetical protein
MKSSLSAKGEKDTKKADNLVPAFVLRLCVFAVF